MKAVLALAFLALTRAAIIERPVPLDEMVIRQDVDPMWMRLMFEKHGLVKPSYDPNFVNWGKTIGVNDVNMLNNLRGYYDKPSLVFFKDPAGKIISYYAHEGIDKVNTIPEVRSAFTNLYGSADKLAVDFRPDVLLGSHYKSVLPGHFFEPVSDIGLTRYLETTTPLTYNHVTFKPQYKGMINHFQVDTLPNVYKNPVSLETPVVDTRMYFSDATVIPSTHGIAGIPLVHGVAPHTKATWVAGASPMITDTVPTHSANSYLRSALSPSYHLLNADYPYFAAAPATGLVDSTAFASPALYKTAAAGAPLIGSADSAFGYAPIYSSAIPSAAAASPFVRGDYAFSPAASAAGAVPLFKTVAHPSAFGAGHALAYSPLVRSGAYAAPIFGASAAPYASFGASPYAAFGATASPYAAFDAGRSILPYY